jgi:hypothetical protein
MNTAIPGFSSTDEPFALTASMWLIKHCKLNKIDLKKCDFLAYPFGADLKSNVGSSYLWEFIKNELTYFTSHIFAFNLLIFLSFVLSGWLTFLLVYRITNSNPAAIFSSFIFAFSPYHFARSWQHLGLAQIQWMPLYLFSLLQLKDKPDLKNTLFVAIALFLVCSFNFYYGYFMFVATGVFLVFILLNKRGSLKAAFNLCLRFCLAALVAVILISPSLWEFYRAKSQLSPDIPLEHTVVARPFHDLFAQSAKPLSYFLPLPNHPLMGKLTEQFVGSSLYGDSLTEHALYLGWTPLVLVFIALRRWKRNRKLLFTSCELRVASYEDFYIGFFIFLAIAAWFFSQPPWWKFWSVKIYLPSFFMYKLLPMFRAYCRFGIVEMLAVAVLAGFGLKFILGRFKSQTTKIALTTLLCSLVLFEFWNWPPYKVIDVSKVPAVYYWLKEQPKDIAIAEYPLDADSPNVMYKFYQTKHEKKIINGTIPGTYANKVTQTITRLSEPKTAESLKWMGVRYVLVHKEGYLNTELIAEREELDSIPNNTGLKLIGSFPLQECPEKDIMCVQKSGPIDVYEITAQPKKPNVEHEK